MKSAENISENRENGTMEIKVTVRWGDGDGDKGSEMVMR